MCQTLKIWVYTYHYIFMCILKHSGCVYCVAGRMRRRPTNGRVEHNVLLALDYIVSTCTMLSLINALSQLRTIMVPTRPYGVIFRGSH